MRKIIALLGLMSCCDLLLANDTHYTTYQQPMYSGLMRIEQAWDYTTERVRLGLIDAGIHEWHQTKKKLI